MSWFYYLNMRFFMLSMLLAKSVLLYDTDLIIPQYIEFYERVLAS